MNPTRHPRYARQRFRAEVISHAIWLHFRFPLSLRMVEEMLAARGLEVSHEAIRQWALKFGQSFATRSVAVFQYLGINGILMVCHEHISGGDVELYKR
jgi:transposase-like protein